MSPTKEEVRALRIRHRLTQKKLAESLYDISTTQVINWESGRRNCPGIILWAMVLTWDKMDLWSEEDEWRKKYG